jgi:hypothetical protein
MIINFISTTFKHYAYDIIRSHPFGCISLLGTEYMRNVGVKISKKFGVEIINDLNILSTNYQRTQVHHTLRIFIRNEFITLVS